MWEAICDRIESRIHGGCLPVAWRLRPGLLQDLECEFGSLDPVLAEYAVDFCVETAVVQKRLPDLGPRRLRPKADRRSRAKKHSTPPDLGDGEQDRLSPLSVAAAHWEEDGCEFPSDMELGW